MPRREIAIAFKHILACSKTACLDESKASHAQSVEYHDLGFADLPMVILCDPKGNYKRIQNDPTTSRRWCFGPNGLMRVDITDKFEAGSEIKNCFLLHQKWLSTSTKTTTTTTTTTATTTTTTKKRKRTTTTTTTSTTTPFIDEDVEIISLDFSEDAPEPKSLSLGSESETSQYLPCFKVRETLFINSSVPSSTV